MLVKPGIWVFLTCLRSESSKLWKKERQKLGRGGFGVLLLLLSYQGQGLFQTCRIGWGDPLAALRVRELVSQE